jgi:hypothetical protein
MDKTNVLRLHNFARSFVRDGVKLRHQRIRPQTERTYLVEDVRTSMFQTCKTSH